MQYSFKTERSTVVMSYYEEEQFKTIFYLANYRDLFHNVCFKILSHNFSLVLQVDMAQQELKLLAIRKFFLIKIDYKDRACVIEDDFTTLHTYYLNLTITHQFYKPNVIFSGYTLVWF